MPVKRPQLGLGGQLSVHPQAIGNVLGFEIFFRTAIDLDTIAGREQHQLAAASFTQHRFASRVPGESLARFNLRRVMTEPDTEKFHA
jgi:hypothetical protein